MEGGEMRLQLSCPTQAFVVGSVKALPIVEAMQAIGFTFKAREVPGGMIAVAETPVVLEVETVEQLVELQLSIGLPFRLEDGFVTIGD